MPGRRSGFTLIEMLLVLVISSLLISIGMRESPKLWNKRAVDGAADAVSSIAYKARSEAIIGGQPIFVWVLPDDGIVQMGRSTSDLLETVAMSDHHVTMSGDELQLCYTARGYAMPGCTNFTSPKEIAFTRGDRTRVITVMPLGQMWRDQ